MTTSWCGWAFSILSRQKRFECLGQLWVAAGECRTTFGCRVHKLIGSQVEVILTMRHEQQSWGLWSYAKLLFGCWVCIPCCTWVFVVLGYSWVRFCEFSSLHDLNLSWEPYPLLDVSCHKERVLFRFQSIFFTPPKKIAGFTPRCGWNKARHTTWTRADNYNYGQRKTAHALKWHLCNT